jgi:hypothetical protein
VINACDMGLIPTLLHPLTAPVIAADHSPGDPEALYTGLVPCASGDDGGASTTVFGASARHTILLPPCASVAEHLCGDGGGGAGTIESAGVALLVFQV